MPGYPSLPRQLHPYSAAMAKSPDKSKKPRDYARPTRAKAARPEAPAPEPALDRLLNPGIERGTAGMGSGTGLQPPPDNSFERRSEHPQRAPGPQVDPGRARQRFRRAAAVRLPRARDARASPALDINAELRKALGFDGDPSKPLIGENQTEEQSATAPFDEISAHLRAAPREAPDAPPDAAADHARRHRQHGVAGAAAARGPRRVQHAAGLDAAPPAAAGEVRGRQAAGHQVRLRAEGRPADRDQGSGRGREAQRPHPGAARRHRLRQDLHHGEGDRGDAAPGADPGAEQDAGRAALRRVQELLPRQRGGVFRLVLRLLPAGSLRPAHRHLHREGILDQRADRPHAPLGDALAAGARRRGDRGLGVVHLRHRLGRDLFGDDLHAEAARPHQPAPIARRPGGAAIQAHQRLRARLVPGARRHHRHLPGALRRPRLARSPVRRRDRQDRGVRSAHRPQDRRPGIREGLRELALRHAAADAVAGDLRHQVRAQAAARRVARRRPAAGGAAAGAAHALRSRDDGGDRKLRRHRELFALSHRPQAGRAAADAVRIRARQRDHLRRREPRHRSAARRHVSAATSAARRRSPNTASGCRPAWTTGRCASRNGTRCGRRPSASRRRPARGR